MRRVRSRKAAAAKPKRKLAAKDWFPVYLAARDTQQASDDETHSTVLVAIEERDRAIAARINAAYMELPDEVRNPAIVREFEKLDRSYQESNLAAARRGPSALLAAGMRVVPRKDARPLAEASAWLDRFLDLAAAEEHRGWCVFMEGYGWAPTETQDDPRDNANKRHEALFPWEDLYESNRDKDRRQVRIYLEIVYDLGFGVTWD